MNWKFIKICAICYYLVLSGTGLIYGPTTKDGLFLQGGCVRKHHSFKCYSSTLLHRNLSKQLSVCLYFTGKHIESILQTFILDPLEL